MMCAKQALPWLKTLAGLFFFVLPYSLFSQFQIDPTFGHNGKVSIAQDVFDEPIDIITDSGDNLYVLANFAHTDSLADSDVGIIKLLPNGKVDSTFAVNGVARTDFPGFNVSIGKQLLLHKNKLLLLGGGYSHSNADYSPMALMRFNINGSIDSSFGANGNYFLLFASAHESPGSIAFDSADKIIVTGYTRDTGDIHSDVPVIARLYADGGLDTSFAQQGKIYLRFAGGIVDDRHLIGGQINDLVVLDDGRLLAAGGYSNSINIVTFFACFHADGSLDSSFFSDGYLALDVVPFYDSDVLKLVKKNGNIFFAVRGSLPAGKDFYFGKVDIANQTYDVDALDFDGNEDLVKDMMVTSSGKILFTGYSILPQNNVPLYSSDAMAIGGLNIASAPFSVSGQLLSFDSSTRSGAVAFVEQSSGGIVCLGFSGSSTTDLALMRLVPAISSIGTVSTNLLRVYPNPFKDELWIQTPSGEKFTLRMFDAMGKLVFEQAASNTPVIAVNGANLSAGTYYLQLTTETELIYSHRVLKR